MWGSIKAWFKHSMTILWARVQQYGGVLLVILSSVDLTPMSSVFPAKWAGAWLVFSGVMTEIARRRSLPAA